VSHGPPLVVAKCIDLAEFLTREAMPEVAVGSRRICVRPSEQSTSQQSVQMAGYSASRDNVRYLDTVALESTR